MIQDRFGQAAVNAIGMWSALGRARGHDVLVRRGAVAISGQDRGGTRIMLRGPEPDPDEIGELFELGHKEIAAGRPVVVEDPWGTVDASGLGLTARQLPVMVREPGAVPAADGVVRVGSLPMLRVAERVTVDGFPIERYLPYRAGEMYPPSLLEDAALAWFLLERDGSPAGACLGFADGVVGGVYWMTTLPEHRSKGVGRALMHAVLRHFADVPVTLTAAKPGKPLYDSLGFVTAGLATWWR
jgi:GNAT superfamily N-acetyltransferase